MSNPLIRPNRDYNLTDEFTLTENQTDGVEFMLKNFNSILNFKAGEGKCFLGSTRVQSERGYLPIESLYPEAPYGATPMKMLVSTPSGEADTSYFYKERAERVLILDTDSGNEFNGTPDHKILVMNRKGRVGMTPMRDIHPGDYVLQPYSSTCWDTSSELGVDHLTLVGWGFIMSGVTAVKGDRLKVYQDGRCVEVTAPEDSDVLYRMSYTEKLWFMSGVIDSGGGGAQGYTISWDNPYRDVLLDIARSCGFYTCKGSSGYLITRRVHFEASKALKRAMKSALKDEMERGLAIGVGGVCSRLLDTRVNSVFTFQRSGMNLLTEVPATYQPIVQYHYHRVEGIREIHDVDVYDLEVPGDHLFMAQGCVNHNTFCSVTCMSHILNYKDTVSVVIVCPKAATTIFIKEIKTKLRLPLNIRTADLVSTEAGARITLFNYSKLDDLQGHLESCRERGIKVVGFFDEVHKVMSNDSALTKRLTGLRHYFACVYGITATVLLNSVEGLYNLVNFVRPGYLGGYAGFSKRYLITKERRMKVRGKIRKIKDITGYQNLDELREKIQKISIVRGQEYQIEYHYIQAKLSQVDALIYEEAAQGVYGDLVNGSDDAKDFGARLHDLQRVVDGRGSVPGKDLPSKLKTFLGLCSQIMKKGESVIVYTEYEDSYQLLHDYLEYYKDVVGYRKIFMITGKIKLAQRKRVEQDLSGRDIVIITKAGSESINLQRANHLIFYNLPFAVGSVIQSIGRIARMDSQFLDKNVYLIEAEGTIDTYKKYLFQERKSLIDILMGSDPNLPSMVNLDADAIRSMRSSMKRRYLWKHQ